MIVAQKVQQTVEQQIEHAVFKRLLQLACLLLSDGKRHHDIAKQRCGGLMTSHRLLGKSQDIGRTVLIAIRAIEFLQQLIARQDEAEFSVGTAKIHHRLVHALLEGGRVKRYCALTVLDANSHQSVTVNISCLDAENLWLSP